MELDDDEGGWARDPGRNKNFLRGGCKRGGKRRSFGIFHLFVFRLFCFVYIKKV